LAIFYVVGAIVIILSRVRYLNRDLEK
jgi:hypothetical protein